MQQHLGTECSLYMILLILQKDCMNYEDALYMKWKSIVTFPLFKYWLGAELPGVFDIVCAAYLNKIYIHLPSG